MSFVHLHSHTQYSLLDGMQRLEAYIARVKELGQNAAAITDHGVMFGCIKFYEQCKKAGIKPILGCEVYVAPESRFDKSGTKADGDNDDRYHHLVLLAETNEGLDNLNKICSAGFIDGFYYKPRVDKEILAKYHKGIICLSACLAGEIPRLISREEFGKAKEVALWYKNTFGANNYFLELQDHGMPEQRYVNMELVKMSKELDIPLVCTNDCHYTYKEDAHAHEVFVCMQTNKLLTDENRMIYPNGAFYVKSEQEMREVFPYCPEAIENTQKIADRCNIEIEFGNTKIPKFDVPAPYTAQSYLRFLCEKGLKERYPNDDGTIKARLDYELSVIESMGFVEYFLIVWNYVNYARENGIFVGPGRGSAAGSVVSYTLKITNIDPIKFGLFFERFLNPERISMPDIDVDFDERRGEVMDYARRQYGDDKVTQIITFGTLAARGVIRPVGKVLGLPYATCDKIAKMIPKENGITLKDALEKNPEFKNAYENDAEVKNLIDICMRLEGLLRNTSMHAAGVVIYKSPATEYIPLATANDGTVITQYEKEELEHLGLLKMDFLGLKTLTVIHNTLRMIKENTGKDIDIEKIDYDDPDVLAMISTGMCDGIFQLESGGMQGFMKELKPQSLNDIIAGIALYRPGPMDFIPKYIAGKNDPESIAYPCKELKPILEDTYGCIVYQEQVMQIVRELAGYSMGQADTIRKAMSKKKQDVIDAERKSFVYGDESRNIVGCIKNGINEDVANSIYDSMVDFAKYAFNKSHAVSYAIVAMQTAWLRHYYPVEYMAAMMSSVITNPDSLKKYILATKKLGIKLLLPNVNKSFSTFTCEDGCVRFGLVGLKAVGFNNVEAIVEERNAAGEFTSFENFLERTATFANKQVVESLIKAGALDMFGYNRHTLMENFENVLNILKSDGKKGVEGQMTLFEMFSGEDTLKRFDIKEFPEYTKEQILDDEKEVSKIYLSGHPLEDYEKYIANRVSATLDKFVPDEDDEIEYEGDENITIAGMLTKSKITYTKRDNKQMMFATLEDTLGEIEIVVFSKQFEKFKNLLKEGEKLIVKGTLQQSEKGVNVLANEIQSFADVPPTVWVKVPTATNDLGEKITKICEFGKSPVKIYAKEQNKVFYLKEKIVFNSMNFEKLKAAFGSENVKLT